MLQMIPRVFIPLLLIFLMAMEVFAQGNHCALKLTGSVKDTDGISLAGVAIWVESSPTAVSGGSSEADGTFTIPELCPGHYTIRIKFIGYKDQVLTIDLPISHLDIVMEPDVRMLHEIVVEGEHAQQHSIAQSVSVFSEDELDANKGKPLGEMLKQIPGVNSMMMGPAIFKPVIHGLHSQRILILNNGIRQEGQQWGSEHAPELDTYIASEIEVVKGAEAVRYGSDALGGVIIVNTPSLWESDKPGGELNVGLMSNGRMGIFSGMVEGGFKRSEDWRWRLQGTAKRGGDFQAANYNLSNTGLGELDFSASLGYKKDDRSLELYFSSFNTEIGILRSAHTGNLNDLQSSIENQRPWYIEDFTYDVNNPKQKINHQLLKVKSTKNFGDWGKLNILYGGQYNQRKEFDIRRGGRSDKPALSLDLFSNVLDASLDHSSGNWSGSIGLNGTFRNNRNVPGTGIKPLIPDYNLYAGGLFAFEKIRKDKWLFEAGGRYDHQYLQVLTFDNNDNLLKPVFNFNYISGSFAASYYFSQQSRFLTNLGISARPPHVSELYSQGLHHGTGAIEEGLMLNDGVWSADQSMIKKEVSKKWINTFQFTRKNLALEISAYANFIDHYIYLQPTETRLTIRGYFPVFQYEQTNAILTGADAAIGWDITKRLSYKGKFSYLYANDITNNDRLPFIPPVQFDNSLTYTWTSVGRLKNVHATLSLPTSLKQYRAPITVYPADIPDYNGAKNFDFMPAPDGYTLVNIAVGGKLPVGGHDLTITLSSENLLNASYRNYMNRLRYYADDTGRNVMVRLKYDFHKN